MMCIFESLTDYLLTGMILQVTTLSSNIMVQWKMAVFEGKDPIGDTPIFHRAMIMGGRGVLLEECAIPRHPNTS